MCNLEHNYNGDNLSAKLENYDGPTSLATDQHADRPTNQLMKRHRPVSPSKLKYIYILICNVNGIISSLKWIQIEKLEIIGNNSSNA